MVKQTGRTVLLNFSVTITDQCGAGSTVQLFATNRSICPVHAFQNYTSACGPEKEPEKPFFRFKNGRLLSQTAFRALTNRLLKDLPNGHRYTSHSFRIEAATTAAANHVPDYHIQSAGMWRSEAYCEYIRPKRASPRITFYN